MTLENELAVLFNVLQRPRPLSFQDPVPNDDHVKGRCVLEPLLWFTVAEGQEGCRVVGVAVCVCVLMEKVNLFTHQQSNSDLHK